MIKTGPILVSAAILVALAGPGWAQSRGGSRGVAAGHIGTGRFAAAVAPRSQAFGNFGGTPAGAVAGPVFNYPHSTALGRLPHPRTGGRGSFRNPNFLGPFNYGYVLPLYYSDGSDVPYPPQQPSAIVAPQPYPNDADNSAAAEENPPAETAAPDAEEPAPAEPTPFILAWRDGQIQQAVAFTITGDRLTYITRDGLRHTIALSALDKDATRQMNDLNGTTLVLPN
jgi:hypothetical protein